MTKPRYENEEALKSYIQEIIRFRNKKDALNYIDFKLSGYSFLSEFTDWTNEQKAKLNEGSTNIIQNDKIKIQKPEPCPEIFFGVLSKDKEEEHISTVKKHIRYSEKGLFKEIERKKDEMSDLKESIRYSTADDKQDLIMEHLRHAHEKEDLAYMARFATVAINNPYFGRFDFRDENSNNKVLYISKTDTRLYVGDHHDVHFVDWRSPIADVFYRYQSPVSKISFKNDVGEKGLGDLVLTARFKIEYGVIKDISYSSSVGNKDVANVANNILQDKLSKNSSEFMTEIVETIQPEQNTIVRHDPEEDMIVQGVAGSGKTAVALHRIAYIVYHKPELRNTGVIFISPNEMFSNYVSDVLPELSEFSIPILTFGKVVDQVLADKKGKTATDEYSLKDFVENYYKDEVLDSDIKEKFSANFMKRFNSLCTQIQKDGEKRTKYLSTAEELPSVKHEITISKRSIEKYKEEIKKKKAYVDDLGPKIVDLKEKLDEETDKKEKKKIKEFLSRSQLEQDKAIGAINDNSKKVLVEKERLQELLSEKNKLNVQYNTLRTYILESGVFSVSENKKADKEVVKLKGTPLSYFKTICSNEHAATPSYENVAYLAILKLIIDRANGENKENLKVQHIIIDEAQDYIVPYVNFLRLAFPNATFTILGDINQNVNPYHKYKTLEKLLPNAEYFEMDKAYRSSPEIVDYCNNILGITSVKAVRKSQGEEVTTLSSDNVESDILNEIEYYQKAGCVRIGIVTRDQNEADAIKRNISDEDIVVLPVYQAKGLEFDAVIAVNSFKAKEKELFYVACSRAQHGLTVITKNTAKSIIVKPSQKKHETINSENHTKSVDDKNVEDENVDVDDIDDVNVINEDPIDKSSQTVIRIKSKKRRGLFTKIKDAFDAAIDSFNDK